MHGRNEYATDREADFDYWDLEVDASDPPEDIAELIEGVDDPEEGFFGPESMMWRVNRENALFLCGVTAGLLQNAHPKVAAGVADHSDFDEDPLGRFVRTFEIVDAIVFGDVDTAVEAAMLVRRIHDWVNGDLQAAVGPFEAGESYDANAPENLLWVHATLIEQSLVAYETYVGELTDAERERYYQESKVFGQLFGVPREEYPESIDDFRAYYERELEDTIAVGERGAELRDVLLQTAIVPGVSRLPLLEPLYGFFGAATMPEPAREELDLPWNGRRQWLHDRFVGVVRRVYPHLPDVFRYNGTYRRNLDRLESYHRARLEPGSGPVPELTRVE